MATQGHGEHPAAASRSRSLGKKYRTTKLTVPSFVLTPNLFSPSTSMEDGAQHAAKPASMQESHPSAEAGAAAADPPPPAWASRAKRSAPEKVKRYAPPETPDPTKRPAKKRKSDVKPPAANDVEPTPGGGAGALAPEAGAAVVAAAPSQIRVQLPASAVPGQHCKASYQREGKQCTVSFEVPAF